MNEYYALSILQIRNNYVHSFSIDPQTSFFQLAEYLQQASQIPEKQALFEIINLSNKVISDQQIKICDLGLEKGSLVKINMYDLHIVKQIKLQKYIEIDGKRYYLDFDEDNQIGEQNSENYEYLQDQSNSFNEFQHPVTMQNGAIFNVQICIMSTQQHFLVNIYPQNTFRILYEYIREIANLTFVAPIFEIITDMRSQNKLEKINIYSIEEYNQIKQKREGQKNSQFQPFESNNNIYNIIIIVILRYQSPYVTQLQVSRYTQLKVLYGIIGGILNPIIQSISQIKVDDLSYL